MKIITTGGRGFIGSHFIEAEKSINKKIKGQETYQITCRKSCQNSCQIILE